MIRSFLSLALLAASAWPLVVQAQQPVPPPRYEILALNVDGISEASRAEFVRQTSGLRLGQRISLPVDESLAEAVRQLYTLGQFSDVEVVADSLTSEGVYLTIRVEEQPRLGEFSIEGISRGWVTDLQAQIPLLRGRAVKPSDIARTEMLIEDYLAEKGFRDPTIEVARRTAADGRVHLTFNVDRGQRAEIQRIEFVGNQAFSDGRLRDELDNTPEDRWWRFWKASTFDADGFEEDLGNLVRFYNDRGYYGARVVADSVYSFRDDDGDPAVGIVIEVEEGPRYAIRDITFEGNTVYTDEQLQLSLGFEPGDIYNRTRLEERILYSRDNTDLTSIHSDRGYLRFNAQPTIIEVPGDSLDIAFEIFEGDVYEFGSIDIRGNTKTKDHVIRREIRTIPGQIYSRAALERSIRDLLQLNYFDQEGLARGPALNVNDEDRTVDLVYTLEETGGDQLELSGGWGGGGTGVILSTRVTFNNFSIQNLFDASAWRPVPSGDGQSLSLGVQVAGTRQQSVSLSFTEPWFRGRQTPIGLSLSFSNVNYNTSYYEQLYGCGATADCGGLRLISASTFYRQRLKWPDDFFQIATDVGYRLYDVSSGDSNAFALGALPQGINQSLTLRQSLSRNSLDNPLFPANGSQFLASVEVAPPIGFNIQYIKGRLTQDWYTPVIGRLALRFNADFGVVGSLTGEDVVFERFLVGGSPLESQGSIRGTFGKDLVYLRGYPLGAISPQRARAAVGGGILNKYSAELRLVLFQSSQLSVAPYAFVDAANTWDGFSSYNPAELYRSAGFGAKLLLPLVGLIDINYGYQIDPFVPLSSGETGLPQWRFQFSIGN